MRLKAVTLAVGLTIAAAGLAACAPAAPATNAPPATSPPATQAAAPTQAPAAANPTATQPPAPTSAPTAAPPTAAPTAPRADVAFSWAPGSVTPADSDDVDEIVIDLRTHAGIISGNGNEQALHIVYDPTIITVEEIMEILKIKGHPVIVND